MISMARPMIWHFTYRTANGVRLHCAEAGREEDPLVILLHGFPEFWFGWRYQIADLVQAGYRVLAPDQRGYNLSAKPKGISAYDLDTLAGDVIGLADSLGRERFALIGHDWGGVVGWWVISKYPSRVSRFVALNAPHPKTWQDAVRSDPRQHKKSSYARFFRLPWLPELALRRNNFKAFTVALRQSRNPEAFNESSLAEYRAAWSQPGALTAMLNWYRALLGRADKTFAVGQIAMPVMVIWGVRDPYLIPELAGASAGLCINATVKRFDEATHWTQYDDVERVNALLLEFLSPERQAS